MEEKLLVSSSPHLRSEDNTTKIMLDVIIALLPAAIASVVLFGPKALLLIGVCVSSSVAAEFITRKIMKRPSTIGDLSAAVTGLILALNLPVTLSPVYAAIGSVVAIVVVKQCFGGIGQNFVNPAMTARVVLMVSFPTAMSRWVQPFWYRTDLELDALTTATPLSGGEVPDLLRLFFGVRGGCLGETCAFALLLGGAYLLIRRVIQPWIPLCYIGTVFVFTWILGGDPVIAIFSGGLLLGAIFMATDYTTSPLTLWGKVVFGVGAGILTVLIREFAALPEGVSYSILLMNILVPHIEKLTRPIPFGESRK